MKIVLNSIKENELRKITRISIGTNHKQSNEQLPKKANISEFEFDTNTNLISKITAQKDDIVFEKATLIGGDIFNLTVSRNINNIDEFLQYCFKKYQDTSYQTKFSWIDNIKSIKDKELINNLNNYLIKEIKEKNFNQIWMPVPEIFNWEMITYFEIIGDKQHQYLDIGIKNVIKSIKGELTNIEQLNNKKIRAISSENEQNEIDSWSAYKCIIADITFNKKEYCLNNGKWFEVDKNFVKNFKEQYEQIPLNTDNFIEYDHENEDEYNDKLCLRWENAAILHKIKITIDGRTGNDIEPCDVFYNNKIIHIKHNAGSNYLSHLFNQALVASEIWIENLL